MADGAQSTSLADRINETLTPFSDFVSSVIFFSVDFFGVSLPLVVVWLMAAAVILTLANRFVNIRGFAHGWSLIFNPQKHFDSPGAISHFQALSAALSGTVGLGNIASEEVLARVGMKTLGKAAAIFFAIMAMGASVSVFQVNQSHAQFANVTGISAPVTYGIIMSVGVAVIILGGIKRIGGAMRLIVPSMGVLYVGAALIILAMNVSAIPEAMETIFRSAFGLDAAGGGLVGALINGMKRATYSSEAGVGSAAIAHAQVRTKEPMTEGYVALLEPFIDTVVVCTLTGLVVIVTGAYLPFLYNPDVVGIEITSAAFESAFGWFPYVLLVASVMFAFSTLVGWAFYGAQAAAYLFGPSRATDIIFKLVLCFLLSTGAAVSLSAILNFIDSMLFGMAIPNIIALYLLLPELRRDVKTYEAKQRIA